MKSNHSQIPPNFDPSRPPPDIHPAAALPYNPYLEMLLRCFQGDLMQIKGMMGWNKQMTDTETRPQPRPRRQRQHRRQHPQPPAPRHPPPTHQRPVVPQRTPTGCNELPIDLSMSTPHPCIPNSNKEKAHLIRTDVKNPPQVQQEGGQEIQIEPLDLTIHKTPIVITTSNESQSFLGLGPILHLPT